MSLVLCQEKGLCRCIRQGSATLEAFHVNRVQDDGQLVSGNAALKASGRATLVDRDNFTDLRVGQRSFNFQRRTVAGIHDWHVGEPGHSCKTWCQMLSVDDIWLLCNIRNAIHHGETALSHPVSLIADNRCENGRLMAGALQPFGQQLHDVLRPRVALDIKIGYEHTHISSSEYSSARSTNH